MRLAVFTNQFPGPVSTFFARDMRGLINAGIDVDIFPFYPVDPAFWQYVPDILNQNVFPRARVHQISILDSLRTAGRPVGKLCTFLGDLARLEKSAAKYGTERLIKTAYVALKAFAWASCNGKRYDHILAYWGNYSATAAYVFHRLIDYPIPFSMFLHAGLDLYEGQVYLREKLLYADNIIVVCEFNREFLQNKYADIFPRISQKIYKHHLGIDMNEFKYNTSNRSKAKVLAVGSLEKYKGFDYLIRAGRLMTERGFEYSIDIIGDGKEAGSLKQLAAALDITRHVNFLGWVPPDEVRKAMCHSTILVHPSYGLGDAVPTVIKEAMACGTPVVASNIAGIPELLNGGRSGILVEPGKPNELARGIQKLLTDEKLRERYVTSARRYAEEQFDLWQNGQKLANILNSTKRVQPVSVISDRTTKIPAKQL
jgi:glycosyltransferase involved in cell wall biosynthesis